MSNWAGGVLTAAGRALQAKVEAGATALVLTKIKLGDGTESMDAVDNLTDLVGPKAVLGISSSVADGDHATITGVMLSTQLQAGFWCREWGLFARDPDAGEILYMVTIDAQSEWLPASTAAAQVSATYAMNIAVANATNIEVNIDPAGLVDVEMLQSYMGLAKRSTAVALGDTAMLEGIPAGYFFECTTAGITAATAPVITSPTVGGTVTDGTVVWTIRKAASTQDLSQYLPLSGGAMTGNTIKRNVDDNHFYVMGGTMWNKGAYLDMFGKDSSFIESFGEAKGCFMLSAENGTDEVRLVGQPNLGQLLLRVVYNNSSQKYMDLGSSAIVAKSLGENGYIKRADGLVYQWGTVQPSDAQPSTVTLPISLNTFEKVFVTPLTSNPEANAKSFSVLSSKSAFIIYNGSATITAFSWFCIGR